MDQDHTIARSWQMGREDVGRGLEACNAAMNLLAGALHARNATGGFSGQYHQTWRLMVGRFCQVAMDAVSDRRVQLLREG